MISSSVLYDNTSINITNGSLLLASCTFNLDFSPFSFSDIFVNSSLLFITSDDHFLILGFS